MATRKDPKSKTEPRSMQRKSRRADECPFPSEQERLPPRIPGTNQVAMGTAEEIVAWLGGVPRKGGAILITFTNEASYREYGPIFWHVANKLPEVVAHAQRRRFEKLVDALTLLLLAPPEAVSAAGSGTNVTRAKRAQPRR